MTVYKLSPIDIRSGAESWAASTILEAAWVEARDELAARHYVEGATLKIVDRQTGRKPHTRRGWMMW